ncbi:MAG TPA: FAD-dependent monooxygenase [Pyrinomonadaceae bacterium]|nr:FAD-dependent monooxygenase [Pyrinomonadaceae bacterium]
MPDYEIIIVGAGPAGCATALQLANLDPELARRTLLLDKAVFPRTKLCAGGLSPDADSALEQLGVEINAPAIPVHKTRMVLPTGYLTLHQENLFRVIRRDQFDYSLFQSARDRGIVVQDGEVVEQVVCKPEMVIVQTPKGEYRCKTLIAADGANGPLRGKLGLSKVGRVMVAMELHAPARALLIPNFDNNMAVLDLSLLNDGIPGYCWVFPSVNEGTPLVSLGIFAAPLGSSEIAPLKGALESWLAKLGIDLKSFELQAHPILRYDPKAAVSLPRVLFAGDAAGTDPLFGEGIGSALTLGIIAARSAFDALRNNNFSFSDYEDRIRLSAIGSMMRRRRMIARRLYSSPRFARLFLRHGALLRGLALLRPPISGAKLTWEAR